MKNFKFMVNIFTVFGFMAIFSINASGVVLDSDTFNTTADGWSGTNVSWDSGGGGRLFMNRDQAASKTFSFGAGYANAVVDITLTTTEVGGWESDDVTQITANGTTVYNSNVAGSLSFSATLNGSGDLSMSVMPNTNNGSEDLYMDNFVINYTPPPPEIGVSGNSVNIVDGDNTPSTTDYTDFGSVEIDGATTERTFSVSNSGGSDLTLGSISISGTHSGDFSVVTQPSSPVAAGGSTTFTIRFDPSATGIRNAAISFSNNDSNENPFNFSISGTGVNPYASGNNRPFTMAYSANKNGNIKIIGNATLKHPTSGDGCTALPNNDVSAVWIDIDGDAASLYNSTSATLTLPAGVTSSKILYAALYWQGRLNEGTLSANQAQARTVKLKLPGYASYQTLSSDSSKFNWNLTSGNGDDYQGVADVTTYLRTSIDSISEATIQNSGYSQTIWVADVFSAQNRTNGYGAWSIVVAYENENETFKNLSVYDGFLPVDPSNPQTIPLTGFLTPSTPPVNASFYIFGGEGDINYGDRITLSNKTGTDIALNGGSEAFKSSVTDENGNNVTSRNPSCPNTIGVDIHSYSIGTNGSPVIIGTDQNSTTVKLTSFSLGYDDYDTYFPGVFAFATDLYQPKMCYIEEIFDSTNNNINGVGVMVENNKTLRVRVTFENNGAEIAKGVQIIHQFADGNFSYNQDSTYYANLPAHTNIHGTDAEDGDLFKHNTAQHLSIINLGSGATSATGGSFATITSDPNAYAIYEYSATVKTLDQNFSNTYKAAFVSDFGLDYSANPLTITPCSGVTNSFWASGSVPIAAVGFDTRESSIPLDNNDRSIFTKIADKPISLNVVSLNSSGGLAPYVGINNNRVYLFAVDSAVCALSEAEKLSAVSNEPRTTYVTFMQNDTQHVSPNFTETSASKNDRILMNFINWNQEFIDAAFNCSNSNTQAVLNGVPQCLNSDSKLAQVFPNLITECLDPGNITYARPACQSNSYNAGNLPSPPYDNEFGCYQCLAKGAGAAVCSTDNFSIRPNNFDSTVTGGQIFTAGHPTAITFNADNFTGSATSDYNETEHSSFVVDLNISDSAKVCADANITFSPDVNFTNGTVTSNYTLQNIGDFNLSIHELNGSEFAHVDYDDTSDIDRLITPHQVQIRIIPHHFDVNGTLENGSSGFTYLNNFDTNASKDQNISAYLNLSISPKSESNVTTSNYTSGCYAKNGTVALTLTLNPTPTGLNNLLWYNDSNHTIIGSNPIGGAFDDLLYTSNEFNSSAVGSVVFRLNFDRNTSFSVNPFMMSISNVNVEDDDNVTGNGSIDNNATYVYGRTHAARQRYEDNNGTVKIYFESYCFGATCDKTLLPNGAASKRVDDVRWYQNQNHVMPTDGTVGSVAQKGGVGTVSATAPTVANPSQSTLNYNGSRGYPYKTTMENNASGWLIQNEFNPNATTNEFQVEFDKIGGWTGKHETNTTTKTPQGATTNRRIMW